jgi:simple sugar transport system ATP-binding protein
MSLSDRIAVMFKGKIIDTVNAEETTKEALGLLMAGVHGEEQSVTPPSMTPEEKALMQNGIA